MATTKYLGPVRLAYGIPRIDFGTNCRQCSSHPGITIVQLSKNTKVSGSTPYINSGQNPGIEFVMSIMNFLTSFSDELWSFEFEYFTELYREISQDVGNTWKDSVNAGGKLFSLSLTMDELKLASDFGDPLNYVKVALIAVVRMFEKDGFITHENGEMLLPSLEYGFTIASAASTLTKLDDIFSHIDSIKIEEAKKITDSIWGALSLLAIQLNDYTRK